MKVTEHIENAKKTLLSFEILPPLKGKSIQSIYDVLDPLMEFKPSFINVTYHRSEFMYKKTKEGFFEKVVIRKRPGTVGICSAIMHKYEVDAVPHLTCGGFTVEETEDALIDLNFVGINNVLLLRGDPVKSETFFAPEPGGHNYAIELVKQAVNMNKGMYLEEDLIDALKTDFCIGVAGYPEKHYESPNMKTELKYLKEKVDAGANYIVTQMFFDNQKYFDFVQSCREIGITVPIIPGLKPITSKKQISMLPRVFHVDIPESLGEEMDKCKNDVEAKQVGVEWAIQQSKELKKAGVPCLHYYTMSNVSSMIAIAKEVF